MNGHEIYTKHERVPIILSSKTLKIRTKKFLIDPKECLSTFVYFLRNKGYVNIEAHETFYMTDRFRTIPSFNERVGVLYYHLKSNDGYLYLNLEKNVSFG
jgi:hypothetical protein